ncbi:MAG: hypothetical protein WCA46_27275, partial [Actinocatenispora sp.]
GGASAGTVGTAALASVTTVTSPVPGATRTAQRVTEADGWPDGPTDFSPDDPVPSTLGGYDQFAPGDEPLDEPLDPASVPPVRTMEDEAFSILHQTLGAEKIEP